MSTHTMSADFSPMSGNNASPPATGRPATKSPADYRSPSRILPLSRKYRRLSGQNLDARRRRNQSLPAYVAASLPARTSSHRPAARHPRHTRSTLRALWRRLGTCRTRYDGCAGRNHMGSATLRTRIGCQRLYDAAAQIGRTRTEETARINPHEVGMSDIISERA